jgi:hypothetical protein
VPLPVNRSKVAAEGYEHFWARGKNFWFATDSKPALCALELRRSRSNPEGGSHAQNLFRSSNSCHSGRLPAYAADLCTDAHMKQMDKLIAEMTDPTKQKEATAALDQSKAAMEKGDKAGCMQHMTEAHKAMGL